MDYEPTALPAGCSNYAPELLDYWTAFIAFVFFLAKCHLGESVKDDDIGPHFCGECFEHFALVNYLQRVRASV